MQSGAKWTPTQKTAPRDNRDALRPEHTGANSSVWPRKIQISSGQICHDEVQHFPWVKGGIKTGNLSSIQELEFIGACLPRFSRWTKLKWLKTVWLLINNINMKKFTWRNCAGRYFSKPIFFVFHLSRKRFSKFQHKMFVIILRDIIFP